MVAVPDLVPKTDWFARSLDTAGALDDFGCLDWFDPLGLRAEGILVLVF